MSEPVIKLKNITKIYTSGKGIEVKALDNVNLTVYEGEIVIIMGPSGSGKTTLLNIIGTLDKPTNGRIILDGIDVTHLPEKKLYNIRLEKIGFVFQFFNLVSTLTALENVMLPMILLGKVSEREAREKAEELLKIVGLGDKLHSRPIQMSGGQQQRVAIARSLANDPSIVLMDEPTGSVDVISEAVILRLIQILNKYMGTTFVIVTHNPEVSLIGHRIVYIRGGKIYETKEIPKINLENALDEKSIVRMQLYFLKRELERIMRSYKRGLLTREDYQYEVNRIKKKLKRIARILGEEIE